MTFGIRVSDAGGAPVWDTTTAEGGVMADVRLVPANTAQTFTYPVFPGRTCAVLALDILYDSGLTTDTTLGYPRVQVAARSVARTVLVWVF